MSTRLSPDLRRSEQSSCHVWIQMQHLVGSADVQDLANGVRGKHDAKFGTLVRCIVIREDEAADTRRVAVRRRAHVGDDYANTGPQCSQQLLADGLAAGHVYFRRQ